MGSQTARIYPLSSWYHPKVYNQQLTLYPIWASCGLNYLMHGKKKFSRLYLESLQQLLCLQASKAKQQTSQRSL